jgi:hypothetical protein
MATGLEGGSYYEVGQRYRAALARESVQVELRSTSGSAENFALAIPLIYQFREFVAAGGRPYRNRLMSAPVPCAGFWTPATTI